MERETKIVLVFLFFSIMIMVVPFLFFSNYHSKETAINSISADIAYDKVIHLEEFKDYKSGSTLALSQNTDVLKYNFNTTLKEETQLQKDILNSLSEEEFKVLADDYYNASYNYLSSFVWDFIICLFFIILAVLGLCLQLLNYNY